MTEEEIEKKAEEYANKQTQICLMQMNVILRVREIMLSLGAKFPLLRSKEEL